MTAQEKIIALAKLAGRELNQQMMGIDIPDPKYLTSYDDIIPLVQKMDMAHRISAITFQMGHTYSLQATPSEIADALLKAKGLL